MRKIQLLFLGIILTSINNFKKIMLLLLFGFISCNSEKTGNKQINKSNICNKHLKEAYYEAYYNTFVRFKNNQQEIQAVYSKKGIPSTGEPAFYIHNLYDIVIKSSDCYIQKDTLHIGLTSYYKDKEIFTLEITPREVFIINGEIVGEKYDGYVFLKPKGSDLIVDSFRNYYTPLFEAYLMQHKDKFPKELFEDMK
ncbi:MAG: hypothetical protein IPL35_14695 [Sphingobacteriales bacterium]|nr:hypothetical protein [Sphingobacteriales bacterium]